MPRKVRLSSAPEENQAREALFEALIAKLPAEPSAPLMNDTLRTRRKAFGHSAVTYSTALKVADSSLRNYESGARVPLDPETLHNYMRLLCVDFEQFLQLYRNTVKR